MRARLFLTITAATLSGCAAEKVGIIVMAHGGNATWNNDVEASVAPLHATYPVEIAYGMARPIASESAPVRPFGYDFLG